MVCDIVPHAADILILIRQSGVVRLLRVNLLFQQLVFGRESGTPRDADHAHIQMFDATRLSLDDKNSTWKKQNGKNYHGAGKADHGKKSYGKHYQKPKYQKEQYDKCDD